MKAYCKQLISFSEAQAVVGSLTPLPSEQVPLRAALGAVTAEPVRAAANCPTIDSSLKDGYAVRSADVAAAGRNTPITLKLAGTVVAGSPGQAAILFLFRGDSGVIPPETMGALYRGGAGIMAYISLDDLLHEPGLWHGRRQPLWTGRRHAGDGHRLVAAEAAKNNSAALTVHSSADCQPDDGENPCCYCFGHRSERSCKSGRCPLLSDSC